jgi:hypothetical protein
VITVSPARSVIVSSPLIGAGGAKGAEQVPADWAERLKGKAASKQTRMRISI